jgi:hypothetical protein
MAKALTAGMIGQKQLSTKTFSKTVTDHKQSASRGAQASSTNTQSMSINHDMHACRQTVRQDLPRCKRIHTIPAAMYHTNWIPHSFIAARPLCCSPGQLRPRIQENISW